MIEDEYRQRKLPAKSWGNRPNMGINPELIRGISPDFGEKGRRGDSADRLDYVEGCWDDTEPGNTVKDFFKWIRRRSGVLMIFPKYWRLR